MKETFLVEHAVRHLASVGWDIRQEYSGGLPYGVSRVVDVAGVRTDGGFREVLLAEAKLGFTEGLRRQIATIRNAASRMYIIIPDRRTVVSRAVAWAETAEKWSGLPNGVGVLSVGHDGSVCERVAPMLHALSDTYLRCIYDRILRHPVDFVGGSKSCPGVGPRVSVIRRVDDYVASHPGAGWDEIFRCVPNHYASAKSMASAIRAHREWVLRRKEMVAEMGAARV